MRLFANRNDSSTDSAQEPDSNRGEAENRFSEGFELLFGRCFQKLGDQIDRIEAVASNRLDSVEKAVLRQEDCLGDLTDKSGAALERENDEYKRRKSAEDEFRLEVARLRASLESAVDAIEAKGEIFERLNEPSKAFEELLRRFEALEANSVGRSELANLFGSAAQRIIPDIVKDD